MASITNVKIGRCTVTFDGVDLGHTKGGVTVSYEPEIHDVTVDAYGSTPAEKVLIGQKLKATVPLAESTISNMSVALPAGTADSDSVKLGGEVGLRLSTVAGALVLHPVSAGASILDDVVIYKAVVVNTVSIPFLVDGERILEVEFEGIIDETRSAGDMLGLIGNSA